MKLKQWEILEKNLMIQWFNKKNLSKIQKHKIVKWLYLKDLK